MDGALFAARRLLEEVTPLKTDCGRLCGAACCASLEGEETGMLLFPGEAALYGGLPGWRLETSASGDGLVFCPGTCRREDRPLSCRMFPLLPLPRPEGGIRVRADLRARAVCPLSRMGLRALDPAFQEAVRQAGELLAAEECHRAFLARLAREQEELRALQARFRSSQT